jgi:hypothetical protein
LISAKVDNRLWGMAVPFHPSRNPQELISMKSLSLAAAAALLALGACSSSPTAPSARADAPRHSEAVDAGDWGGALGSGTLNTTPPPAPADSLPTEEDNGGGFMGGGNRNGGGFLGSGGT